MSADPTGRPTTVRVFGPVPPPVHGAARVTQQVVDALREAPGVRLAVFDSNDGQGLRSRLATMLRGLVDLLLARRRGDAVYLGGAGGELLWYQAVVVALARLGGQRTVFHHHNSSYLSQRSAAMALLCRAGGARLVHVVLCEGMGERLRARYPHVEQVRVCSNAGLMAESGPADEPHTGARVLGHLSNLTVEKGLPVVLDTMRHLLDEGLDVRLLLAGPCVTPESERLVAAARTQWPDRLEVTGRLDADGVEAFYRNIDVFVFPSTYANEAEPLVVLDAMRHGVPSVAYDVGCVAGMVEPGHAVPTDGDLPAVVAALVRSGPEAAGEQARARFVQRRADAVAAHEDLVRLLTTA